MLESECCRFDGGCPGREPINADICRQRRLHFLILCPRMQHPSQILLYPHFASVGHGRASKQAIKLIHHKSA